MGTFAKDSLVRVLGLALAAGALGSVAVRAELRLNEIVYDADGPDAGREFVELVAPGATAESLGGYALERGNGGRPGDWRRVWEGGAGTEVPSGGFWVVGGVEVDPMPDAVVELGLQNGPDACRLVLDGNVVDLVGWGEHRYGEYVEKRSAPDPPAGAALGRVPDGRDTDDNQVDWQVLESPSPGAPNRSQRPAQLEVLTHYTLDRTATLRIDWRVVPRHPTERLRLCAGDCIAATAPVCQELDGITEAFEGSLDLVLARGELDICLELGGGDWRDTTRVAVRVGPGVLRVSEIMAMPGAGQPEWFEVANVGASAVPLGGYAFEDARHQPVPLVAVGSERWLGAGLALVVAERPAAGLPAEAIVPKSWPALNDGGDVLRIVDPAGRTTDQVRFEAAWLEAGASIERLALDLPGAERTSWVTRAGGTPGRLPEPVPPGTRFLQMAAGLPVDEPLVIRLAEPLAGGALSIFRIDGVRVFQVDADHLRARTELVWPASPQLAPGIYLVHVEGTAWHDGRAIAVRSLVTRTPVR